MKKLDNRGFSLVELMVVIGIIAIILGSFTYGYSVVSNKEVDQCAKKIQTILDSTRSTAMGKRSVNLQLYYNGGKIIAERTINGTEVKKTEVGDDSLIVSYTLSDGTSKDLSTDSLSNISFDRASGSLNPSIGKNTYLKKITISNGRKNVYIEIDKLTGRVTFTK